MKRKLLFLVLFFSSHLFAAKKPKLHQAILNENIEEIDRIISSTSNINRRDVNGNTPVHLAVVMGRYDIVSILLSHGADGCILNNFGESPFDLVQLFGHHVSDDFFRTGICSGIPFQTDQVFENLQVEMFEIREILLNKLTEYLNLRRKVYMNGKIVPSRAIAMKIIYGRQYSVHRYQSFYYQSSIILQLNAFQNGQIKLSRIRKNLERQYIKKEGLAPSKTSFMSKLRRKRNGNSDDKGKEEVTPSNGEVSSSSSGVSKVSPVENYQDTMVRITRNQYQFIGGEQFPLLHRLVFEEYAGALHTVISARGQDININEQDVAGNTALHIAVLINNIEMVQTLLVLGANPRIRNHFGETPFHLLRIFRHYQSELTYHKMELLLQDESIPPKPDEVSAEILLLRIRIIGRVASRGGLNPRHPNLLIRFYTEESYIHDKYLVQDLYRILSRIREDRSIESKGESSQNNKEESKEEHKEESKEEGKQEEKESEEESKVEVQNIPDVGTSESASSSSRVTAASSEDVKDPCSICYENTIDTVSVSCGHAFCCKTCRDTRNFESCPICRLAITFIIPFYMMSGR